MRISVVLLGASLLGATTVFAYAQQATPQYNPYSGRWEFPH
jgi:hypothetical protein